MSLSNETLLSVAQDWKYPRTAKGFTGTDQKNVSNTILRCVTNTRIPCTAQEFASMGKTRFTLTVIGVGGIGWAYAPYKKPTSGNKRVVKDSSARALFEVIQSEDKRTVLGTRLYSFKKAKSSFDRDEVDLETKAEIYIGQVMTFFVQPFMYTPRKTDNGSEQHLFPRDISFIPEFTVVDMHLMTSHNETDGGYGCKLKKIALHPTSLYSYLASDGLKLLPVTHQDALDLAVKRGEENRFIHNQFESKNVAFFARVPTGSFVSSVPVVEGYYRIVGPNGSELFPGVPCVDVFQDDLFRFSNAVSEEISDRVLDAITLFDFSSCASALWLYVVGCQAYKSGDPLLSDFKGVPLVDVDVFLNCVDFGSLLDVKLDASSAALLEDGRVIGCDGLVVEDGQRIVFPFRHDIPSLGSKAFVTVHFPALSVSTGVSPPCPDFSLLSEESVVGKGYLVTIGTKIMPDVLRVVLNVLGCSSSSGLMARMDYVTAMAERAAKRRRIASPISVDSPQSVAQEENDGH